MSSVLEVLSDALRQARKFNPESSVPPAAIFWPDPDRAWEPVIGLLQEALPVLVLGAYEPGKAQGPAIWVRAALSASDLIELPAHMPAHDDEHPWVIYLPGRSRSALADIASVDPALSPLAEVALRSNWWPSEQNQPAWTPHSFLASKFGARLDIARDHKTKAALASVLERIMAEDVDELRQMGRLDAPRLHSLVMTDSVRTLLEWLNDPDGTMSRLNGARWETFAEVCRSSYGFDPVTDGVLSAAARLGGRDGAWSEVWARFADNARRYPNIPQWLDRARPAGDLFGDSDPHPDSWPSWNREREDELRNALAGLRSANDLENARMALQELAAIHAIREESVWAELGHAPLARAAGYLAELAQIASRVTHANDLESHIDLYVAEGHRVDDLALRAIAAAVSSSDREAVCKALMSIYDPWLDDLARSFQAAAAFGYEGQVGLDVVVGTCVVFVDALRFDLAHRLIKRLTGYEVSISSRLAAFPTVTPTGQPAVAPVAKSFGAGLAFDAADSEGRSVKGQIFRSALLEAGVSYLDWRTSDYGDVSKVGWTQTNMIDALGHSNGHALVDMIDQQLDLIAERIRALLDFGWSQVRVVTDHGFLMPASPAPKVELPLAVTEGDAARKPRVARLKPGANKPGFPIVPWTWDSTVEMVSAPGAAAFEQGTIYEHGGLSPQECVLPVIDVGVSGKPAVGGDSELAQITSLRWTGQRCRVDFDPVSAEVTAEIRLAPADATSAVGGPKAPSEPGEIKVLVDEARAAEGTAAYVVLLTADGLVVAQHETIVGGPQ